MFKDAVIGVVHDQLASTSADGGKEGGAAGLVERLAHDRPILVGQ